ncbi:MAG: toprim domain-containing protein [Terricaulis sp.]
MSDFALTGVSRDSQCGRRGISALSLLDLRSVFGGDIRGDCVQAPSPGHSPRDRGMTLRLRSDGRGVLVNTFNADWKATLRHVEDELLRAGFMFSNVRPPTPAERKAIAQAAERAKAEREARQLMRTHDLASEGAAPEPGGPVRTYLAARGLPPAVAAQAVNAGALREHRDEHGRPAMLALSHGLSGCLRAVQMTKLKRDGSGKRGAAIDRYTFGAPRGAACRLFKFAGDTLAIAEGTETALAFFALRGVPTWAAFGARNLAAFEPPRGVRKLIIAADGDRADPDRPADFKGLDAAEALLSRLKDRVRVVIAPAPDGLDWLDVLSAERRLASETAEVAACR